jgi:hypothetical protein
VIYKVQCPIDRQLLVEATKRTKEISPFSPICHLKRHLNDPTEVINVYFIGGSVTAGAYSHGCCSTEECACAKEHHCYRCTLAMYLSQYLNNNYRATVNLFNLGGLRGNPDSFAREFKRLMTLTNPNFENFTSNDIVFLDYSANEANKGHKFRDKKTVREYEFGAEALIRRVFMNSLPRSFPTVIYLANTPNPFVNVHHAAYHHDSNTNTNTSGDSDDKCNQSNLEQFPTEVLFEWDSYEHDNYSYFDFESLPSNFKTYTTSATTTTNAMTTFPSSSSSSTGKSVTPSPLFSSNKTVSVDKKAVVPSAVHKLLSQTVTLDQSPLSTPRGIDPSHSGRDSSISIAAQSQPQQQQQQQDMNNSGINSGKPSEVMSTSGASNGGVYGNGQFVSIAITVTGDMNVSTFNTIMNPFFVENARQNKLLKCYGFLAFDRATPGDRDKFVFIGTQTQIILQRTCMVFYSETDRCSRLVFVGKNLNVDLLVSNLRLCVVNPSSEVIVKVAST